MPNLYSDAAVYVLVGAARMARYNGSEIDLNDSITSLEEGDVVVMSYSGALSYASVEDETDDLPYLVLRPINLSTRQLMDNIDDVEYYYDDLGLLTELVFGSEV